MGLWFSPWGAGNMVVHFSVYPRMEPEFSPIKSHFVFNIEKNKVRWYLTSKACYL